MKAVTIPQPWASLIAHGEAHFRTFTWDPGYTGLVAIHTGDANWSDREKSRETLFAQLLARHNLTYDELPFGQVIAVAKLVAVHHSGYQINQLSRQERKLSGSPHWTHRFMFEFRDMELLANPAPASGKAHLWEWDGPPVTAVTEDSFTVVPGDSLVVVEAVPAEEEAKTKRRK